MEQQTASPISRFGRRGAPRENRRMHKRDELGQSLAAPCDWERLAEISTGSLSAVLEARHVTSLASVSRIISLSRFRHRRPGSRRCWSGTTTSDGHSRSPEVTYPRGRGLVLASSSGADVDSKTELPALPRPADSDRQGRRAQSGVTPTGGGGPRWASIQVQRDSRQQNRSLNVGSP
ncbi:hypothetical protein LZ30DRAFT_331026 [Colletotrichum cereale]|nr:hypothetical protein LZ30DRAFT_331026 [Colletotrichum cereale]